MQTGIVHSSLHAPLIIGALTFDMSSTRRPQAEACPLDGRVLGRILDHGNAILKPAIPFVPKRCLEMRDLLKASDLGEAVLGIERGVPTQMAECCERDVLKGEVLRSCTGLREELKRPVLCQARLRRGPKP